MPLLHCDFLNALKVSLVSKPGLWKSTSKMIHLDLIFLLFYVDVGMLRQRVTNTDCGAMNALNRSKTSPPNFA